MHTTHMRLADWLSKKRLSVAEFARRAAIEASTAHRAVTGKVMPSPGTLRAIRKATDGAVTPNDFYDHPGDRPCDTEPV